jgi:DMSO/TMAO reductase YedYZ molybdopterin-dependent catalytic subunit
MLEERRIVTPSPENSETPLEAVRSWVTPARLFFVRNHFEIPQIDLATWRLDVGGLTERTLSLTWDELNELPQRTVLATLECAGNGRSFLTPRQAGVPWGAGAVAHAEWSGVPLSEVLDLAGVRGDAREVICAGADRGTEPDHPEPMNFVRGLPLDKARHRDTLLALRMNGEPLTPSHGFPVRLLVPGWYGVASVKWLARIELSAAPLSGYFQTHKYTVQRQLDGRTETVGIQGMAVKSEIVRPIAGERLASGRQRIVGLAWAGEEGIGRVEVSTDGGGTWADAELLGPLAPYSWTLWEHVADLREPGPRQILARATSTGGRVQPREHDPLLGGYMIHFSRPIEVHVEARAEVAAGDRSAALLVYDMNAFAEANARRPLDVDMEYSYGSGI